MEVAGDLGGCDVFWLHAVKAMHINNIALILERFIMFYRAQETNPIVQQNNFFNGGYYSVDFSLLLRG